MRTTRTARSMRSGRVFMAAALLGAAVVFLAPAQAQGQSQTAERGRLVATLDSLAQAHVSDSLVPGVSVAVVHHGDTLLLRGTASPTWSGTCPWPTTPSSRSGR